MSAIEISYKVLLVGAFVALSCLLVLLEGQRRSLISLMMVPFLFAQRLWLARKFHQETHLTVKQVRSMYEAMLNLDGESEYGGDWRTCKTCLGVMHFAIIGFTLNVKLEGALLPEYHFTVNQTEAGRMYVDVFEASKRGCGRGFLGEWRSVYREGEFQKEFAWVRMLKELFLEA